MSSSPALANPDWQLAAANANEAAPADPQAILRAEWAALESLVSAAVLVTTAFRLRDETGLVQTLRLLSDAVSGIEARHARKAA